MNPTCMSRVFFLLLPMLKNVNSQIGQGSQNEIAPSKMVRVKLKYGSARVSEDYSKETIDVLNHLSEVVYNRYTEAHGSP